MAVKIAFINEKGGVGKSSCCFNVAWELSKTKKVLIIDLDGQRANVTYFAGVPRKEDLWTMADVVISGRCKMKDAIVNIKNGLDIVPATTVVSTIDHNVKIRKFKEAVASVEDSYDYIFIDVNPTPNWSHVLCLGTVEKAIIVMLPDVASLEADLGALETVEEVQESVNPKLRVLGFLINKYDGRTILSKEALERAKSIASQVDSKVFETKIRSSVSLGENVLAHVGITEYDPKSRAAADVRKLVEEIVEGVE